METSPSVAAAPRIGIWGTFDLENYGDMLFPLVLEFELGRRMPEAVLRRFSPVGAGGPNRFDAGRPAEGLGPWSPSRVAELADELDLVLVGGGEIIHTRDGLLGPHYGIAPEEMERRAPSRFFLEGLGPDLEREVPVVWSSVGIPFDLEDDQWLRTILHGRAYVTVRDEVSAGRVSTLGIAAEIVPDPVLLVPRLWDEDRLERRLRHLRAMGWYPERGWTLIAQGNAAGLPHVEATAAAIDRLAAGRDDASVVILSTGPIHGDDEFAGALEARLGTPALRIPEAGLEDVAAAIARSDGFVGSSLHGAITAAAYGRPHAILWWGRESKLEGFARLLEAEECLAPSPEDLPDAFEKMEARGDRRETVAALQDRVDRHLDRVAEMAREAAGRRATLRGNGDAPETLVEALRRLREAYEARGRLLATGRWAAAEEAAAWEAEAKALRDEVAWQRRLAADAIRRANSAEEELEKVLGSRSWRSTEWLRSLARTGRRMLGRE